MNILTHFTENIDNLFYRNRIFKLSNIKYKIEITCKEHSFTLQSSSWESISEWVMSCFEFWDLLSWGEKPNIDCFLISVEIPGFYSVLVIGLKI